jgi:predicted RNA-binding Zn-ribbon protein involved in translation (DUF1610 family)
MNDQQDEQQPIAPTAEFMAEQTTPEFECPKCGKGFDSAVGLRMHRMRVHTLAGRRGVKSSHAEHLEKRRAYQLKLRQKYYREGKDSRGRPRPAGWKPRKPRRRGSWWTTRAWKPGFRYPSEQPEYKRRKYREKVKEYRAAGLNAHGQPLKGNKSQRMSVGMKESWARRKAVQAAQPVPNVSTVQFCPRCGANIKAVAAALAFSDRQ